MRIHQWWVFKMTDQSWGCQQKLHNTVKMSLITMLKIIIIPWNAPPGKRGSWKKIWLWGLDSNAEGGYYQGGGELLKGAGGAKFAISANMLFLWQHCY